MPVNIKTYRTYDHAHNFLYKSMLELTESINDTYPQHTKWYLDTFLTGLKIGDRGYTIAECNGELAGVALFKDSKDEKKISTLFVAPAFRKQGIATRLLNAAKKEVGPGCILTVSARNVAQLRPVLDKCEFRPIGAKKGEYKPDNIEYYFKYEPSKTPVNIRAWAMLNQRSR